MKVTHEQPEPWVKSYCGGKPNYTTPAEQKPVAWIQSNHLQLAQRGPFSCRVEPTQRHPDFVPLYTHPPRRECLHAEVNELKRTLALQQQSYEREIQIEVEAEREACAKVCDQVGDRDRDSHAYDAAAAIRARGQS
jgi:hypothetical protein